MKDKDKIIVKINGKVKEVPQNINSKQSEETDEIKMAVPWFLPTSIPKRVTSKDFNKVISFEDFKVAKNKVKKEYKNFVKKIIVSIVLSLFFGLMLGFSVLYMLTKTTPTKNPEVAIEATNSTAKMVPVKLSATDVKVIQAGVFSSDKTAVSYIQQFSNKVPYGMFKQDQKNYLIVGIVDINSNVAGKIGQKFNELGLPTYLKNITLKELNFNDTVSNQKAYNNQRLTFLETLNIYTKDIENNSFSRDKYIQASKAFNLHKPKTESDEYNKFTLELSGFYKSILEGESINNLSAENKLLNTFIYYYDWSNRIAEK
jgi:uncharacterized protein YneF (UPF0154 family)